MSQFYNDSIFWIEVDKIDPNPFQPRKEFNEGELQSLADSIRQYGVLQALVVTRKEEQKEDGGIQARYELIAGERRLRASKLAGIREVPALIRSGEDDDQMKLELAIIENIQREDLNVVDRARAFRKLADDFKFSHSQIAKKIGKSREYVTNSLRVLTLPEYILDGLLQGKLTEGHTRPLCMLCDRPQEQETLFKEILFKKMSVREAERIARRIAYDRVKKANRAYEPGLIEIEETMSERLGTRVHIERKKTGGKIYIDFYSDDDLEVLFERFLSKQEAKYDPNDMLYRHIERTDGVPEPDPVQEEKTVPEVVNELEKEQEEEKQREEEKRMPEESDDLYSINNFSI